MVSASGSETSVSTSTPTSAIIYDAYTSIIKKKIQFQFRAGYFASSLER